MNSESFKLGSHERHRCQNTVWSAYRNL